MIQEYMSNTDGNHRAGEPSLKTLRTLVLLGHVTLAVTLASWLLMYLLNGKPYENTWWIIFITLVLGRGAAVGYGLGKHFSPMYLFFLAVMADVFLVFYIYPLFVRNYRHLKRVPHIGIYLDNLHTVAIEYKSRVAPYGIAGLLAFVIFPFWSTGPLVGAVLGFLIGLPAVATLLSVTIGNIIATAIWVWFYDSLHDWNQNAALILLLFLLFMTIIGLLYTQVRHTIKKEEQVSDSETEEDNDLSTDR